MISFPKIKKQIETPKFVLPLLPLRDIVVFPYMIAPLFVGRSKSVNALSLAMQKDKSIFLATQIKSNVDNPMEKDINKVGTIGKVLQLLKLPDGTVKALVEGRTRAKAINFINDEDLFQVELQHIEDIDISTTETEALCRTVIEAFDEYSRVNKGISKELVRNIASLIDPAQIADTISSHFAFKMQDKQNLLETASVSKRLSTLTKLIKTEIEIFKTEQKVKGRVKKQMEKTQKQYYLNEQMRAIKKEMGADDEHADELKDLERKIKRKRMSKESAGKVRQEFKKLKLMTPMSAEGTVVRNYIDWLICLPWFNVSRVQKDIENAEKILNDDHYGLEKPKERILEYLAVQTLVKKIRGPILCFVGPPGVGKTSLSKSVARATGRKFVRLSLGGVRDEAEIRGHRRTYIGAMPGKIMQSLKKVSVNNPVFCLDEVDKMSMDFRGDPSAALLEVLDPEQNNSFNDHYLDVDYDLSDILFITTANTLDDIPLPLQDRMEVIQLPGYTETEKLHIATDFLVPKQIRLNGLGEKNVHFSENAILTIIQRYTREAGVRNLEREIASICRKIAKEVVTKENSKKGKENPDNKLDNKKDDKEFKVIISSINKYLGPYRFRYGLAEDKDQIGLVTGLAWTKVGGELLAVETLCMPGKGVNTVTGKLGDVMKESAQAAVSYVRSRADSLDIDPKFYKKIDIHIHIPEGAIPKDGPSAGITMCTSIVSALAKVPVSRNVAMTGEITLRGRVLPIGGLKEKILAAHRGGIKKVIIPGENKKDLKDIPQTVLKQLKIVPVEHMDEVLDHSLVFDSDKEKEALLNGHEILQTA